MLMRLCHSQLSPALQPGISGFAPACLEKVSQIQRHILLSRGKPQQKLSGATRSSAT
jgi:hypothetical protein